MLQNISTIIFEIICKYDIEYNKLMIYAVYIPVFIQLYVCKRVTSKVMSSLHVNIQFHQGPRLRRHESTWSQSLQGCCTTTTAWPLFPVVFEPQKRGKQMPCTAVAPFFVSNNVVTRDVGSMQKMFLMLGCFPTFSQLQDLKSQSRLIFQGSSATRNLSSQVSHHS